MVTKDLPQLVNILNPMKSQNKGKFFLKLKVGILSTLVLFLCRDSYMLLTGHRLFVRGGGGAV